MLFFVFMTFAALSTVIAVFENIMSFTMDQWGTPRKKACLVNGVLLAVLSMPCVLGLNVLAGFTVPGIGDIQEVHRWTSWMSPMPGTVKPASTLRPKTHGMLSTASSTPLTRHAFFRGVPHWSMVKLMMFSNTAMTVDSAANVMNTKNSTAQPAGRTASR